MSSTDLEKVPLPVLLPSVAQFYALNDDLHAVQAVSRRMFFEFLRTKPGLTDNEIQIIHSISDLLAGLAVDQRLVR
jgi:hypothetical protein